MLSRNPREAGLQGSCATGPGPRTGMAPVSTITKCLCPFSQASWLGGPIAPSSQEKVPEVLRVTRGRDTKGQLTHQTECAQAPLSSELWS